MRKLAVEVFLQTTALAIRETKDGSYEIDVVGAPLGGRVTLETSSVIVATGCRERTRGQLMIPGTRPAGVLTAGTAQYMINIKNQLPGNKVVILGSGDIGLIMARRLTLEGATVKLVLGQEATGLLRNHISCIKDFDIPIRYGWGVVSIVGRGQLYGVHIAPLKEDGSFDLAQKTLVRCNVLLVACGLIPEREVLAGIVDGSPGVFVCGNAQLPKDLVDQVTKEGIAAGVASAEYVAQGAQGARVSQDAQVALVTQTAQDAQVAQVTQTAQDAQVAQAAETRGTSSLRPLPHDLAAMASADIEEPKGSVADVLGAEAEALNDENTSIVVCTLCPTGCAVRVEHTGKVQGHSCERGKDYALAEAKQPLRTFTGTVLSGDGSLIPVRSAQEVPREYLGQIARVCKRIKVPSNMKRGDTLSVAVKDSQIDIVLS